MVISNTVAVATKEYHTSADGLGMSGPTWHPINVVWPNSDVAPTLVRQNSSVTALNAGHGFGVDNVNPHALAQSSGTGVAQPGMVPTQGGAAPQGAQLMVAVQPGLFTVRSEVKTKVRHPVEEVIKPGEIVPVKIPIRGDAAVGPSCILKSSHIFSTSKLVKFTEIHSPLSEQKVVVMISLFP
jgi:hypothetical protein